MAVSTEKLCDVFEMLVSRLDTIETSICEVKTQLDAQALAARHADTLRQWGTPFSGVAMTGEPLTLHVFYPFNVDGTHKVRHDPGLAIQRTYDDGMIVAVDKDRPFDDKYSYAFWEDGQDSEWDGDLRVAWGTNEYERVRSELAKWWNAPFTGQAEPPSCAEVGIDSSYEDADDAIMDAILRHKVPGFVAYGGDGVAVSTKNLKDAVQCTATVLRLLKKPLNSLHMHWISKELQPLALATLRNSKMHTERKLAWKALAPHVQNRLKAGLNDYFTARRLVGCF